MLPSLKLLHDALMVVQRERLALDSHMQMASTDIADGEENFNRRVKSLQEQSDQLGAQIARLVQSRANVEKEIVRMREVRSAGPGYLHTRKAKLKQLDIQEKTIQLAILQQELNNASE